MKREAIDLLASGPLVYDVTRCGDLHPACCRWQGTSSLTHALEVPETVGDEVLLERLEPIQPVLFVESLLECFPAPLQQQDLVIVSEQQSRHTRAHMVVAAHGGARLCQRNASKGYAKGLHAPAISKGYAKGMRLHAPAMLDDCTLIPPYTGPAMMCAKAWRLAARQPPPHHHWTCSVNFCICRMEASWEHSASTSTCKRRETASVIKTSWALAPHDGLAAWQGGALGSASPTQRSRRMQD